MRTLFLHSLAFPLIARAAADEGKPAARTTAAATTTQTTAPTGETDAQRDARLKAEADAIAQAEKDAAEATEAARAQSLDTLKAQELMAPYPSQEEADAIKARNEVPAAGAGYVTRDTTSK